MEQFFCKDCGHFHQHYVLDAHTCTAINCGHCAHPRLKHRRAQAPACHLFSLREAPSPQPATRHFLTLEILRWAQSLEFPPDVRSDPE